jgi:hypothetical protein
MGEYPAGSSHFQGRVMVRRLIVWSSLLIGMPAAAADPPAYTRDVRPILAANCFKCHGPDQKKGGLDLQAYATATAELKSGERAVVPGKSTASEAVRRALLPATEDDHMPPKGQLTATQIATLKAWINAGAKYEEHWAYLPPAKHDVSFSCTRAAWVRNPIDGYVLSRLEKEGLTPSPEAVKATLIRRASFDLTGLPPMPEEVDAFLADTSPNAYETVVDRLLASPHYGEHLARMWLDLARYADTNGYEKDERRTIWPYRDWVINAFNADLPFDRFTREQLAGDLLPNPTRDQRVATGFHRNSMTNTEGGTDDEEFRVAAVVDRVNTTMEAWLGLSFGCAQCHNHKYDPFSQVEYYRVFAVFNQTTDAGRTLGPELPVPTPEQVKRQEALKAAADGAKKRSPAVAAVAGQTAARAHADSTAKTRDSFRPLTTLVLEESKKPRDTFVHVRGDFRNHGPKVEPGIPSKLQPQSPPVATSGLNRLQFSQWLVSRDNPLAARVFVNRLWARTFGKGLVETLEDFGVQGEPPSHPDLLDWLAVEFADGGWSVKHMMRLIVTSATYRQSSAMTPAFLEKDPANRLLARGPRFRLDAEAVRDNALTISGLLARSVGGPSVFPFQPDGVWANPYSGDKWAESKNGDQFRRGLYTFWRRTAPYAMFLSFDAPSREVACSRRPRTNTPLQALATLNDKAFVTCANALAKRVLAGGGTSDSERITFVFKCCVARTPSKAETDAVLKLLADARGRYSADAVGAKALAGELPKGVSSTDLAAWTVVANVLLNLDETVTKE